MYRRKRREREKEKKDKYLYHGHQNEESRFFAVHDALNPIKLFMIPRNPRKESNRRGIRPVEHKKQMHT